MGPARAGAGTQPLPVSPHTGKPRRSQQREHLLPPGRSRAWVPHHFSFPHPLPLAAPQPWPAAQFPPPSSSSSPLSRPLSRALLFSPLSPIKPFPWCRRETEAGPVQVTQAMSVLPGFSLRVPSLLPLPPPPISVSLSLPFSIGQSVQTSISVSIERPPSPLAKPPPPGPAATPSLYAGLPATCREVSLGSPGSRVAAHLAPSWPGLSPEQDPPGPAKAKTSSEQGQLQGTGNPLDGSEIRPTQAFLPLC